MQPDELEQWLLALPLDEPCDIDGARVYLSLGEGGAELGVVLAPAPAGEQVREALRTGFQGALDFEAGLALGPGGELLLNRWLPGVEAWSDVADPLEDIVNQAALWRAARAGGGIGDTVRRDDARVRQALAGSRS